MGYKMPWRRKLTFMDRIFTWYDRIRLWRYPMQVSVDQSEGDDYTATVYFKQVKGVTYILDVKYETRR